MPTFEDLEQQLLGKKANGKDLGKQATQQKHVDTAAKDIGKSLGAGLAYAGQQQAQKAAFWTSEDNRENRKKRYEDNKKKIDDLWDFYENSNTIDLWYQAYTEGRIAPTDPETAEYLAKYRRHQQYMQQYGSRDAVKAEIDALEAENRRYERGSKVADDYYTQVSQNEDFGTVSANRNHSNPTRADLAEYDALIDSASWNYDENDVLRDVYGNEIAKDPAGKLINPSAQQDKYIINDRLGLYLSASEKDIEEYMGTIVNGTWGKIIGDGIDGDWHQLTKNEIDIYYYLLNSGGQAAADKYLSDMKPELNRRQTLDETEQWNAAYEDANLIGKIGMNAATVPARLFSSVAGSVTNAVDMLQGKDINPYSAVHSGMHYSNTVRGATAEDLDATGVKLPVVNFTLGDLYQSGMSMMDSLAAMGVAGDFGGLLLAGGAAEGEAYRLYQQGATTEQIAFGSAAAGAVEMIFESLSIGNLNKVKNMTAAARGQFFKGLLLQGGVEASEEMLTEIANTASNAFIMGTQSDWDALMRENNGDLLGALKDETLKVLHSGLSGFFSGAGSSGIVSGPAALQQRFQNSPGEATGAVNGGENAQAGNSQVMQETAAEPAPWSLEWVRELNDNGRATERRIRYKESKINQSIMQMVERVKNGLFSANDKVSLGIVSNANAAKIQSLTGIDVRGYKVAVEARQIAHILKDHGENGGTDRSMANPEDIAKIEYALENPDYINSAGTTRAYVTMKNGKQKPADTVIYEKQNGDGSYYVVEAVPDTKKKTLYIVTAFIGKSGYKNMEAPQSTNAYSPGATPTAESADASTNSISQTVPGVNSNSSGSSFDALSYVQGIAALGQNKDTAQTVDTETQAGYDNTINEAKGGEFSSERREETRESFYRRANEKNYTVRERGKISCGYNPVTDKTGRARQTEIALQKLGIPVIVHEGLEANIDGVTKTIHGAASSVAGDVVYVRNNMDTDPTETAGHEAYHFWKRSDARLTYMEIVADNVDFSSDEFVQFQKDIAETYFGEEVGIEDDLSDKLAEEIFAYITGLVHAGDPYGEVHGFLRDYDAVKTAWDALVKQQATEQSAPPVDNSTNSTESVGAAPSGFDPNSHLQYQYGTLPEGKNAVRPDDLPVSTDGSNRVSQTAVTVKGARVTSDEFADLLTKDVAERNGMTYIPVTNDATVQKAIKHISEVGWVDAKAQWHADVHYGKAGADMSAMGALLLNNAAKAGDKTAWLDILHDYQLLGTNTAQGMQALQILKKLTPSDKLYMAKRSVKKMVDDMKLDTEITIDPELENEYNEAETDEQRDIVLVKIQKDVAQQLPTTFVEKFTALRYVNMLGNLRTQVRNIAGNLTMKGTRALHNSIATGIETLANKASKGKIKRTRSLTVNKAQKVAAAKDFESLQDYILDGGKYSDNTTAIGFARGVQEKKQIFKSKPLEGYRKVTNWMMEQGDVIFAKDAYARALAGYLKANGVTETDLSKVDSAVMDDARLFAAKEAQEATFRDTNWLSGWVSKIGRRKDTPAVGRFLSEGIMPFRKTPANVLVRAEEYSPLGIINSVTLSVQAAQNGSDITANQVINSWAKTLTGTGLFGVGMLLQSLGLLSTGPDEDEKKEGFEDLNGWQNYALTLPDGTNLTIDFLSPSAIPVLMGAQMMRLVGENGFQLKDLEGALTSIADPLVEMSMLQGINDSLENIQYTDSNLGQFVINAGLSYLTQGLTNTLFGQIERSFEDSRMQTYVDKDSDLPAWLQRALGKASAKTPGLDYHQIPYINAWGEEEENPSTGLNLIYNLLSPAYFDKGKDDDLTRELNRLNDAQSDVNVYPSAPDKTLTVNEQDYNLSADEYVALAKLQGQTQKRLVENLIASSDYANLSDEEKAAAIRYAYDYARDSARGEVIEEHPGLTTKWMKEIKGDVADGIIRHITADGKYTYLSVDDASYVDELLDSLIAEKGKSSVRTIQQIEAVAGADSKLTAAEQQKVLEDILTDTLYEKYLKVTAEKGHLNRKLDTDDFAVSYRLYLDAEGGNGKKARIIASFQNELGVSYSVAVKLYDIYAGKK